MTETRWSPEKPLVINAICIVGIINSIQMINLILSPMSRQVGSIYPLYFALSVVAQSGFYRWFMVFKTLGGACLRGVINL